MITKVCFLLLSVAIISGCASTGNSQPNGSVARAGMQRHGSDSVDTNNAAEALKLAHLLRDNGRFKAAYDVYKKMDDKGQLEGPFLLEYASLSASVLPAPEAISLFKRAQGALGHRVSKAQQQALCTGLGRAYLQLAQLSQAKQQFDCALQSNPRSVSALNGLGVIASMNGDRAEAQKIFKTALDLAPSNESIINNLSLSLLTTHQYEEAIRLLKTKQQADNVSIILNLAFAYVLNDREDMARETLRPILPNDKAQTILDKYASVKKRIQNGESTSSEIMALTNSPFVLKDKR